MRALRSMQFQYLVLPRLVLHYLLGTLLVTLRYEVPIECLKVDSIPRRLTRRHISTLYSTTPGRWRAPQSNTGNRDRRTTTRKRLRSGSSRSAIF